MSAEIVIQQPKVNKNPFAGYTYHHPDNFLHNLAHQEVFRGITITPTTHPRILDLAAGAGSVARIFFERGWDLKNIYNIDMYVPKNPLIPVERSNWIYWDISTIAEMIASDRAHLLPDEVSIGREYFDIVTCCAPLSGDMNNHREPAASQIIPLLKYFCKPDGVYVAS